MGSKDTRSSCGREGVIAVSQPGNRTPGLGLRAAGGPGTGREPPERGEKAGSGSFHGVGTGGGDGGRRMRGFGSSNGGRNLTAGLIDKGWCVCVCICSVQRGRRSRRGREPAGQRSASIWLRNPAPRAWPHAAPGLPSRRCCVCRAGRGSAGMLGWACGCSLGHWDGFSVNRASWL